MLKLTANFAFVFFMVLLSSCNSECSKKVPCPGYGDAVLDAWFPYKDKQQLIFKSSTGLYDTLTMLLDDSTVAYEYQTGFNAPDRGCSASKTFSSAQKDSLYYPLFNIHLLDAQEAYSTTQKRSASLTFGNVVFFGQDLGDNGFASFTVAQLPVTPQTITNYALGGKIYPLAQSVYSDSAFAKKSGVYKIIYAKNYGIILYETNPGSEVWSKQ